MPKFEVIAKSEAKLKTASAKTTARVKEYIEHISRVGKEDAGKVQATAGESLRAVRRRLGTAAKLAGKELHIKRVGDEIFFWHKTRRGRKPGSGKGRASKNRV